LTWFKDEPRGTLVAVDRNREGLTYFVWFQYARSFVSKIREGDFVAVRSFISEAGSEVFSILELSSVLPIHYALGTSASDIERAYPGFVEEAAKSARQDWEQEEPEEETTKIKCTAIPTGIQLRFQPGGDPAIEDDQSLPMVGEEAHLLTDELMEQVVNRGIKETSVPVVIPGQLVLNPRVSVLVKVEDLLKTHFGIFAFTGAGKSNLVSTLVARMMELTSQTVKVVLFDMMSEYHVLLSDLLHKYDTAFMVILDQESVPGGRSTIDYLQSGSGVDLAAKAISRVALLPAELNPARGSFEKCFKSILELGKLKILDIQLPSPRELRQSLYDSVKGNIGTVRQFILAWIDRVTQTDKMTFDGVNNLIMELNDYITQSQFPSTDVQHGIDGTETPRMVSLSHAAKNVVSVMKATLQSTLPSESRPPDRARIEEKHLVDMLCTDDGKPSLFVVQSDRDDELRMASARLISKVFSRRRSEGLTRPLVLFVYDEADEFIPSEGGDESFAASISAAETLARRGRKFGMGLAIATQRVAYLNTKILGQPHTYFVSKLPRKYDRDVMAQAFGASEDMLNRTLGFTKGQWLLVSYDATGLQNVPVPVKLPNANDRIKEHLAIDTK
jgi:hypothetical protein